MEDRALHLLPGDITVESVYSPYSFLVVEQNDIPLGIDIRNASDTDIMIQLVFPIFTAVEPGDRYGDYNTSGDPTPNIIIPSGGVVSCDFTIGVSPFALTDTEIQIDAVVMGYRLDNLESVGDSTAAEPHHWMVLSEAIEAVAGLFDTRLTPDRADDSLICLFHGENFPLNQVHYLNGGRPLGDMVLDGTTFYRMVLQLS
ncbi:MAG: hypothetical protein KAX38_05550, partial [Candidatus Krumholzibacteria bacterium]|nr:hypothetical protein [Candidatus Krumholzibacteria bacterium]